jgi:nucleoside-diphosphate-sugar epimerase
MERRVPDISRAREWIGFEPRWNLDGTINDVVNSHRRALVASTAS